jgi:photosystem II stability/assembly factor-like uncharacterized protein
MNHKFLSLFSFSLIFIIFTNFTTEGKEKPKTETTDTLSESNFAGLKFRSIGPAFTSGRIADFAVNPRNHSEYYVAAASGHVWKTVNNGTTFSPVFDNYGAYSIGVVTMDPNNSNVVWVGTGENNHQRVLGYGNGVYKSMDGGKSFKNMGLPDSRQIGGIVIDPRNSDVVMVAAEGSLWAPGGDRGLYKTTDGGKSWKKVLEISENTGVNNVIIDSKDPDILYATSEQRRRHVYTKIGGGPESAVYKSTDNGESWRKVTKGLPGVDIGGMGIALSPADHNVVYLIVEAAEDGSGFFRSTDRGESWEKMSDYSASGQYYNEIYCDPVDVDKVFSMETFSKVTEDGGKTWRQLGNDNRHVDDHAFWIDPSDTKHVMIGSDGGVYESFDGGQKWLFKSNLPVTQFYRVASDNALPFYNIYGGTQDNNTIGGPSQNTSSKGVSNEEWKSVLGGDGFWVQADPKDPNIIYAEWQYGNVVRYDKKSGEKFMIKPRPRKDELTYKWNWNAPMIISPHSNTRIYIAANKVFRSDDRGNSWKVISDDITAGIDRNTWPVMDHFWSIDAVAKDVSTSLFGTAVAMVESPVKEDLLYVGTDDGVISITEDAGSTWRQVKSFPGIPANTYVTDILASKFDANVVYATFDNTKRDDFKPYILMSPDKGKTWKSIVTGLPENGAVNTIEQDFINSDLLFTGTEFGFFFSINGGESWTRLKSGMPDISIEDMAIQERENDLILASFGRGFYILDDYSILREIASNKELLTQEAHLFKPENPKLYMQTDSKYGQGATLFHAPNPEFGAVFTYYLSEVPKSMKEIRRENERKLFDEKKPIFQPNIETLRKEKEEIPAYLLFTIQDSNNEIVRKIIEKPKKGINRLNWDLRYESFSEVNLKENKFNPFAEARSSMPIIPGKYYVSMSLVKNGEVETISEHLEFEAQPLGITTISDTNPKATLEFHKNLNELIRVMRGSSKLCEEAALKLNIIQQTLVNSARGNQELFNRAHELELKINDILFEFSGPEPIASWEELPPMDMPLNRRLSALISSTWSVSSGLTPSMQEAYSIIFEEIEPILIRLNKIMQEIEALEKEMDNEKLQWTPGRIPVLE